VQTVMEIQSARKEPKFMYSRDKNLQIAIYLYKHTDVIEEL